jgi:hypothetical protein
MVSYAASVRWACCFLILLSCGPSSKRSARDPAPQMTFDDACGLQEYFDERRQNMLAAPRAKDEVTATNEKGQTIGEGAYKLEDAVARKRFARLLREEYSGVDPKIIKAVASSEGEVLVRVRWWDAGKIRRLRVEDEVFIVTSAGSIELPANMCVSDLLFGDQIYEMRARYLRNEVDIATGTPAPSAAPSPVAAPSASAPPLPSASP